MSPRPSPLRHRLAAVALALAALTAQGCAATAVVGGAAGLAAAGVGAGVKVAKTGVGVAAGTGRVVGRAVFDH